MATTKQQTTTAMALMKMLQNLRLPAALQGAQHHIALIPVDLRPGRNELIAHNAGRNWHLPRGTNIRTGRGIYPA